MDLTNCKEKETFLKLSRSDTAIIHYSLFNIH